MLLPISLGGTLSDKRRLLTLETGLVVQLIEIGKIGEPVNGR